MKKKIFVIDDNAAILEMLKIILTENGYVVISGFNGNEIKKV